MEVQEFHMPCRVEVVELFEFEAFRNFLGFKTSLVERTLRYGGAIEKLNRLSTQIILALK